MSRRRYSPREADIILILVRLKLPMDVAGLILQYMRKSFVADFIEPAAQKLRVVNMIKRILKPSEMWEGLVEIDIDVIDTGWDCTDGRRNLSTLFRYCSLVERVYNDWGEESIIPRPSPALVLMVWQKRKENILNTFRGT